MAHNMATRLTLEQFYRLPEGECHFELVRGYLVREPPPGLAHGWVASRICHALEQYILDGGVPGVVVTCDTWFELSRRFRTVRGPDVAFVTMERFRAVEDVTKAMPGAPDLAVEVLSPSQSARDMREKVGDYLEAGAQEVWVIDPAARDVTVYGSGGPLRRFREGDTLMSLRVLPGFRVSVLRLFEAGLSV